MEIDDTGVETAKALRRIADELGGISMSLCGFDADELLSRLGRIAKALEGKNEESEARLVEALNRLETGLDALENEMRQPEQQSPHIELEQSILGCAMLDNAMFAREFAGRIKTSDFADERHQKIYAAMLDLVAGQEPIDEVTLTSRLKLDGKLDDAGGAQYVCSIIERIPTAVNGATYANLLLEFANKVQA